MSSDLDHRTGWPAELCVLLDRHPRATWAARREVSAQFWLEIHDRFRRDCVDLELAGDELREGRRAPHELAVTAAPRLRALLSNLHGHHQIEDYHYFPVFRQAEPRLAAGFALLGTDHAELAHDMAAAATGLRELHAAVGQTAALAVAGATVRLAAERYAAATGTLCRRLCRHLSDEEDLIVPLLIERRDY